MSALITIKEKGKQNQFFIKFSKILLFFSLFVIRERTSFFSSWWRVMKELFVRTHSSSMNRAPINPRIKEKKGYRGHQPSFLSLFSKRKEGPTITSLDSFDRNRASSSRSNALFKSESRDRRLLMAQRKGKRKCDQLCFKHDRLTTFFFFFVPVQPSLSFRLKIMKKEKEIVGTYLKDVTISSFFYF